MKQIDELIEKYEDKDEKEYLVTQVSLDDVLEDLETLKAELKEQHKKDVVEAYNGGCKEGLCNVISLKFNLDRQEIIAEQYYNENH